MYPKAKVGQAFRLVAVPAQEVLSPAPLVCSCPALCSPSPRRLCQPSHSRNHSFWRVSSNHMSPSARWHEELLCWERGRAGCWGWWWAGALGWAHFRIVLPLKGVYHAPSLGVSQLDLQYLMRHCKFVNKPTKFLPVCKGHLREWGWGNIGQQWTSVQLKLLHISVFLP